MKWKSGPILKYLTWLVLMLGTLATGQQTIWVNGACTTSCDGASEANGFPTIDAARLAARNFPGTSVDVKIANGTYWVTDAIVFEAVDGRSSPNRITYSAKNPGAVTISGGLDISTGWTRSGSPFVRSVPMAKYFRQMYVNGRKATRARSSGDYQSASAAWLNGNQFTGDGVIVNRSDIAPFSNFTYSDTSDLELVWNWKWRNYRILADSVFNIGGQSGSTSAIVLQWPYFGYATALGPLFSDGQPGLAPHPDRRFYLENAFELLDQPGEWYYRKSIGTLYYVPLANEAPAWSIIIPNADSLIDIRGTAASPVSNIQFSGLTFSHTGWNAPNIGGGGFSKGGVVANQAEKIITGYSQEVHDSGTAPNIARLLPAAFSVTHGHNISLTNNVFSHLGTSGISLVAGAINVKVVGNYFNDISGAAITVGKWTQVAVQSGTTNLCRNITISNNLIHDIAREYFSSCGITIYAVQGAAVEHNLLTRIGYTGISSGYLWWNGESNHGSVAINFNYVNDFNRTLHDGGGIYTLGRHAAGPSGGSRVFRNYLRRDNTVFGSAPVDSPWFGYSGGSLYFDQGSRNISGGFNVIDNSPKRMQVTDASVEVINVANNFASTATETNLGSQVLGSEVVVEFNPDTNPDWKKKPGAWYTVSNAGLQRGYRGLLDSLPQAERDLVANRPFALEPLRSLLMSD